MYLVKSIFFGSRIISLNEKQLRILEKMYEVPILKKLGLGKKFPRHLLYVRKSALSIGLIRSKTVLAMTALQQYIRSYRLNNNIAKMINITEQIMIV